MKSTIFLVTFVVFSSILASCEEFKYSGDAVSIIYPQPDVLTRRSSRANDDNIAMDSARVTSRISPMRGQMYEPKSRSSKPTPAFSPVAAVPSSQRTEADSNERKDEADDENEDTKERMESDVVSNNVESDPKNTYLQVGKWIAQWDAPYEAWYYYNSETGVSTWTKPRELETIEFTDPVPDIEAAKKKVKAAHKLKEQEIESEANKGATQSVRLERDKPGHAHGHDHNQHHNNHATTSQQQHSSPVSFTNTSPLTHHNSLSLGPRPTTNPKSRPASQVSDPIFDQNFNRPTNKPQNIPQTLSQQLKLNQQKNQAASNYAGPSQQADTGYGGPTEAPDSYGAPQADPVSSYDAPAPSYGAGKKPVFEYTLECLRRNSFSPWRRTTCFDWSDIFNSFFDGGVTRTGALIGIGAFILFNVLFYTAVVASSSLSNEGQFSLTRLLPQQLTNVFFEKRGFESLLEDFPDTDKILELVQRIESEEELSKTDTLGDEL